jgi:hypothetical protein
MYRSSLFTVIILIATSAQGLDKADKSHTIFDYDVFSEGAEVGSMQVEIIKDTQGGYQIIENTSIYVDSVWNEVNLKSTSKELYSSEDHFISADKKTYDKSKLYWSKIDGSEQDLWMSFSELLNKTKKEEMEVVGLSMALLNNLVPAAGEAIGLTHLLFSDSTGTPPSRLFPKGSHHTTLAHLPQYWSNQKLTLPAKISLLDIETISIGQIEVEYRGLQVKTLNDTRVLTNHYSLVSENSESLNIWLAVNENDVPYFFQLSGEDQNGSFTINLKP